MRIFFSGLRSRIQRGIFLCVLIFGIGMLGNVYAQHGIFDIPLPKVDNRDMLSVQEANDMTDALSRIFNASRQICPNGQIATGFDSNLTLLCDNALTYNCIGSTPGNASLCTGDESGLSSDVTRTLVSSCGVPKCEYACDNPYVFYNGSCCQPDCSGKVCGDNGCGGSCGTCSGVQFCNGTGQCENICTDTCSSLGYTCGQHMICGSLTTCGTCSGITDCDTLDTECRDYTDVSTVCGGTSCQAGSCTVYTDMPSGTACGTNGTCDGNGACNECTPSWTPDPANTCSQYTVNQTDGCGRARTVQGTKNCPASCTSNSDCDDGNTCTADTCQDPGLPTASCSNTPVSNGTSCGTKNCDYLDNYYVYGSGSILGTNYVKYSDYSDVSLTCSNGTCIDQSCGSPSDSTYATCGVCVQANASIPGCENYAGGFCGTKDCDSLDSFQITGTNTATGTSYCKFYDYSDINKTCSGGSCSDPTCVVPSATNMATAGVCEVITQCNASSQTVMNVPDGVSCGTNMECQNGSCVGATQPASCGTLGTGESWYGPSSYTQTWNGSAWTPTNPKTYAPGNYYPCHFVCATNYVWNGSSCVGATQPASCGTLGTGESWYGPSSYTQTWNGSAWTPTNPKTYAPGNYYPCHFVCTSGYTWNGNNCVLNQTVCNDPSGWSSLNRTMCSGDNGGNGGSVFKTLVNSCSSPAGSNPYCEYTCNSGYHISGSSCVRNASCSDTDGNTSTSLGTVSGYDSNGAPYSYSDYCETEGDTIVWEYFCSGSSWNMTDLDCPSGKICQGGACVNPPQTYQWSLINCGVCGPIAQKPIYVASIEIDLENLLGAEGGLCDGSQVCTVVCKNSSNVTVADSYCTSPKPSRFKDCQYSCAPPPTPVTYSWVATYGACEMCCYNSNCGSCTYIGGYPFNPYRFNCTGYAYRSSLICRSSEGVTVSASYCSGQTQPAYVGECSYTGLAWSAEACGMGVVY